MAHTIESFATVFELGLKSWGIAYLGVRMVVRYKTKVDYNQIDFAL